jgi:predicted chitinase
MNLKTFYDNVRPIFGGHLTEDQVEGIDTILDAWDQHGNNNPRHLAYILATAKHETAHTMQPVRETLAKTDAKAKEILTKSFNAGKLPWVKKDYWSSGFFGRGFGQITHKDNYEKAGRKLGVNLVANPSKALDPDIAGAILVRGMLEGWFTGKSLSDFSDFTNMRRIVNGTDRAQIIAQYATLFYDAIMKSEDTAPAKPKPSKAGWLVLAAVAIAGVVVGAYNWIASLFG